MLLRINWFKHSLNIASNNLSAKKRRKFTARNASLYPSLYVCETVSTSATKYKCRCELETTKKDLATLLRELSPTQILIILLISNILRCFDKVFRETIPIFFTRLKKWFYPCLIAMKFSLLTDCGLNSRDKLFNKKVLNDSN